MQTAINSKLRFRVRSPYLAAMVAFIAATLFLGLILKASGENITVATNLFSTQPKWIWIGGILGILGGTIPIILFPHLGSVQTVIIPIFGQIIMGMLIDNFGWFDSPVTHFTLLRLLGIVILLSGVLLVILIKKSFRNSHHHHQYLQLGWQLLGFLAGVALAGQTAVNGRLGAVLRSPVHAAFISFLTGMIVLILGIAICKHNFANLKLGLGRGNPWWIWSGGLLGGSYVLGNSFLVPWIGTGSTVVIVLFGNILGSLFIDQWGLLGAKRRQINTRQLTGLVLMLIGVILIKLF